MWSRAELKSRAREVLKTNYWTIVLVALILSITTGGTGISGNSGTQVMRQVTESNGNQSTTVTEYANPANILSSISPTAAMIAISGLVVVILVAAVIALGLKIFLFNPLEIGAKRFFSHSLVEPSAFSELGYAFRENYMNGVKILFLRDLYISLWTLLFVIPGIVKSYEYYMVPYLLSENPHMDSKEAFAESRRLMNGQKWNAFVLDLSFIGWAILAGCTCGLLNLFYVNPYQFLTKAALFRTLSGMDRTNPYTGGPAGDSYYNGPSGNSSYTGSADGYNPGGNPMGGTDSNSYQTNGNPANQDSFYTGSNNSSEAADNSYYQGYGSGYYHDDTESEDSADK